MGPGEECTIQLTPINTNHSSMVAWYSFAGQHRCQGLGMIDDDEARQEDLGEALVHSWS